MGYAANAAGIINTAQTVPLTVPTDEHRADGDDHHHRASSTWTRRTSLTLGTVATPATTNTGTLVSSGVTITTAAPATNADNYTITFTSADRRTR